MSKPIKAKDWIGVRGQYPIYRDSPGRFFFVLGYLTQQGDEPILLWLDPKLLHRYKKGNVILPTKRVNIVQIDKTNFKLTTGDYNLFLLVDGDINGASSHPFIFIEPDAYKKYAPFFVPSNDPNYPVTSYKGFLVLTKETSLLLTWLSKTDPPSLTTWVEKLDLEGNAQLPTPKESEYILRKLQELGSHAATIEYTLIRD
jgi:hypothetical protein